MLKIIKAVILMFIILQSCSLDFLNSDDSAAVKSGYFDFNTQNDIGYYYDGDDNLQWYERYDYNEAGQCVFIQHLLPSNTVLWSYVFTWESGKISVEAFFNDSDELSWYNQFAYTADNVTQITNYNAEGIQQWTKTYEYSGSGNNTQVVKYNSSSVMEWAYKHEYTSDVLTLSSAYGSDGNRTAYIEYDYDSSNRLIKKTGSGATKSSDSFDVSHKGFNHPESGGVNTENRNSGNLTAPSPSAAPSTPAVTLTDTSAVYAWMSLWTYNSFATTFTTLNKNYLPVYMKMDAPDHLDNGPIKIDITYDEYQVKTKTTTYNNEEVLKLEFEYDVNGYLASLNTTGVSLLIPLRYEFGYENGIPKSIGIYNEATLLQRFDYSYSDPLPSTPEEFAKSIHIITHYDGDEVIIGSYIFVYNEAAKTITISVKDNEDNPNGRFELSYNSDGNTAGFASFDKNGVQVWDYNYSYDDFNNKISEMRLDKDDIPEVAYTFDIEAFFEDLRRFLP